MALLHCFYFLGIMALVSFVVTEKCTPNDRRKNIYTSCQLYSDNMVLWCDYTNFTTIPNPDFDVEPAHAAPNLASTLFVNDSCLTDIEPDKLKLYKRLKTLDCSNNMLVKVPKHAFHHAKKLTVIDLSQNRIEQVHPESLKGLKKLSELRIKRNRIQMIDKGMFNSTTQLQVLELDQNDIVDASMRNFSKLKNLRILSLRNNKIKSWTPCDKTTFRRLTVLDLSSNKLCIITETTFGGMPELQRLFLRDNQVEEIHHLAFNNTLKLTWLDLSNNRLKTIPKHTFYHLCHLETLDLRGNLLHTPHHHWFLHPVNNRVTTSLTSFTAGNPWRCGCKAQEYWAFLRHLSDHPRKRMKAQHEMLDIICSEDQNQLSARPEFNCADTITAEDIDLSVRHCPEEAPDEIRDEVDSDSIVGDVGNEDGKDDGGRGGASALRNGALFSAIFPFLVTISVYW